MIREFPWVPWDSYGNGKHRLNSQKWEREWEWWTGNGREMGIAVWKKFPLVALIIFWHYIFQACRLAR